MLLEEHPYSLGYPGISSHNCTLKIFVLNLLEFKLLADLGPGLSYIRYLLIR